MSPRSLNAQARRENRRSLLLAAARRLFARRGYHATSVPDIVRAASSSIGSFYAHFRNKEGIFLAVLEELDTELSPRIQRGAGGDGLPLAQLARMVAALLQFLLQDPEHARILLIESVGLNRMIEDRRQEIIQRQAQFLEGAIRAGIADGSIGQVQAGVAAQACLGSVLQVAYHFLATGEPRDATAMADTLIEFNVRGLSRSPGREP